jgi:hypothetical protein
MAITSKNINLLQLDNELGSHGLIADFNDSANKVIAAADGSPITEAQLLAGIASHKAVFATPTVAEKLASVGLSLDDLKAALGL